MPTADARTQVAPLARLLEGFDLDQWAHAVLVLMEAHGVVTCLADTFATDTNGFGCHARRCLTVTTSLSVASAHHTTEPDQCQR